MKQADDICDRYSCHHERQDHIVVDYGHDLDGIHHSYIECTGNIPKDCHCTGFVEVK